MWFLHYRKSTINEIVFRKIISSFSFLCDLRFLHFSFLLFSSCFLTYSALLSFLLSLLCWFSTTTTTTILSRSILNLFTLCAYVISFSFVSDHVYFLHIERFKNKKIYAKAYIYIYRWTIVAFLICFYFIILCVYPIEHFLWYKKKQPYIFTQRKTLACNGCVYIFCVYRKTCVSVQ